MTFERLIGQESEYAIRYEGPPPALAGNDHLYDRILDELRRMTPTLGGSSRGGRARVFTSNGGSVSYEALPWALDGGLIEGGTPECRSPGDLLLYQRASEALLVRACERASRALPGEVTLLRNCRDAEGHVYGAQENFEAQFASGWRLALYRLGLALLLPPLLVANVVSWLVALAILLTLMIVLIPAAILIALLENFSPSLSTSRIGALFEPENRTIERGLGRFAYYLALFLYTPTLSCFALLVWLFGFRRVRRDAAAFLISRMIFSGAGTLEPDGSFRLSEKASAMKRVMRWGIIPEQRGVFDLGNLMKHLLVTESLKLRPLLRLFAVRQRLQLGLADANRCQYAEYLKIGATALVLDMIEAGHLEGAPRLKRPLEALAALDADPTLSARVALRSGEEVTALELQRRYLEAARDIVAQRPTVSLEARDVLRIWGEALDALERDPTSLVGRVDWVTKRFLIDQAGAEASSEARKKIDLRYHELGPGGYLSRMEAAGLAPTLATADEIERAITEPPERTPAAQRGRLIREFADSELSADIDWHRLRVGGRWDAKIVQLDEWRKQ